MAGRHKRSEHLPDSEERKTPNKDRGTEQGLCDPEKGYIIATRVQIAFKKWKTLEKDITRKQAKVDRGGHSKYLVSFKKERDKLQIQLKTDIPQLQSIPEDENDSEFVRNETRRATTGAAPKEKTEIARLNNMEYRFYQVEVDISNLKQELHDYNQDLQVSLDLLKVHVSKLSTDNKKTEAELTDSNARVNKQLEDSAREISEWKNRYNSLDQEKRSIEEELKRLTKELADSENEKAAIKYGHQEQIGELKGEIRRLKERTKEQEQVQHQAANIQQNEKDAVTKEEWEILKRKFEESENEKFALNCSHQEEIGGLKEEIRRLNERLSVSKNKEKMQGDLEAEVQKLQKQIQKLTEECRDLEKQKSEINDRCSSLQTEITRLATNKYSYEKNEKELSHLKSRCNELDADIKSYKENWTRSEDDKIQLQIKIKENENVAKEQEKKLEEGEHEIKAWKNQFNRVEVKYNQLTIQLENEKKAKEDALVRLSSMASNKLRDNNPNIADLSDPNRPTKISEQFSELYDNEWTDAFDELEKSLGDTKDGEIISYLRDFVLEIHSVCSDLSSSKLKTIEEAFVKPSVPSEETKVPSEIIKTIKDGIKSMAPKLLEHIKKRVLDHLNVKYSTEAVAGCLQSGNVKKYIDKCTEVCWYMSVQDPQLIMEGSKSPDGKFDSNKHREYTKKGPYEEFVVWPVLYLYRGGQMLSKGVAQGAKKEMSAH